MFMSRKSLSRQLLASILGIYILITLVVTAVHIVIEYSYTKDNIKSELGRIGHIFEPAMQTAIWNLNDEQLQSIGKGMQEMPLVYTIKIVDPSNKVLFQSLNAGSKVVASDALTYSFSIHQALNGNNIYLAKVTLGSSEEAVFERLKVGLLMLFLNACIKSAALVTLFYLAFRKYLERPLNALTNQVSNVKEKDHDKQLIDVKFEQSNELSKLQSKFNELLEHIYSQEEKRLDIVQNQNKQLEVLVKERTLELEAANAELQKLASTDTLTQIANRSKIDETLEYALSLYRRHKHPFSIVLIDIDHFKKINDTHGHLMGDIVLKELALIFKKHIRAIDTVGRWGGEEFMIICNETDCAGAFTMAENIRQIVSKHSFEDIGYVNISAGVAQYESDATTEELIRWADDALYTSKSQGRNQVTAHNPFNG